MIDAAHETFLPWRPLSEDWGTDRVVDRIVDSDDGLTIVLRGKTKASVHTDKVLKVRFDPCLAYRVMDESYRGRTWQHVQAKGCSLYIVENSLWLEWFTEESLGIYRDRPITHYAIYSTADCIDVLSEFPPQVLWA